MTYCQIHSKAGFLPPAISFSLLFRQRGLGFFVVVVVLQIQPLGSAITSKMNKDRVGGCCTPIILLPQEVEARRL
jgi:hypothetical protein